MSKSSHIPVEELQQNEKKIGEWKEQVGLWEAQANAHEAKLNQGLFLNNKSHTK